VRIETVRACRELGEDRERRHLLARPCEVAARASADDEQLQEAVNE
jgi:hypothetical protein